MPGKCVCVEAHEFLNVSGGGPPDPRWVFASTALASLIGATPPFNSRNPGSGPAPPQLPFQFHLSHSPTIFYVYHAQPFFLPHPSLHIRPSYVPASPLYPPIISTYRYHVPAHSPSLPFTAHSTEVLNVALWVHKL